MRSASQIGRTVSEYHDWQAAERRKHLLAFRSLVRAARERGEEWVRWIDLGRPEYSEAEYAAIVKTKRARPHSSSRASS